MLLNGHIQYRAYSSIVQKFQTQNKSVYNGREFQDLNIPVPWGHLAARWWAPYEGRPILAVHGWQVSQISVKGSCVALARLVCTRTLRIVGVIHNLDILEHFVLFIDLKFGVFFYISLSWMTLHQVDTFGKRKRCLALKQQVEDAEKTEKKSPLQQRRLKGLMWKSNV
ncbi:unnamed protein product [Acanthoscelides obtectus]|uniref:Uncharacterized protein n=1 Tax=Acanthoscelides obtectus TaxID=200917 RepID=A0A9P0PF89_ACAOB|nr:unnamed protein product [Acanthoscelides obtectus]CAK1654585.1 hypothetical protein AOBTE_LOCUS18693 [Acanthoscelides obtectus]